MNKSFGKVEFKCLCEQLGLRPSVESCRESGNHEVILRWGCGVGEGTEDCGLFLYFGKIQTHSRTHPYIEVFFPMITGALLYSYLEKKISHYFLVMLQVA